MSAIIFEAGVSWKASTKLSPPSEHVDNLGSSGTRPEVDIQNDLRESIYTVSQYSNFISLIFKHTLISHNNSR